MMARTDIPLPLRKKLAQQARIRAERQDAAETIMKLACVALNDNEGLGYTRLTRFAVHTMELVNWYYGEDPEVADAQLNGRLEQMGFKLDPKDGAVMAYIGDGGEPVKAKDAQGHKGG